MIGIRDDDTSFWTSKDEIERLYGKYLDKGLKLSLAVVPCSHQLFSPGDRRYFYISEDKHYIYENVDLVAYLMPYVKKGQIEIMQHGYDHSYAIVEGEKNSILYKETRDRVGNTSSLTFLPECIYKDSDSFHEELIKGKKILEDTFKTKINTFVPPSNALNADTVSFVEKMGMNISGTVTPQFNRKKDIYSICVYVNKSMWHLFHRKHPYPKIMKYQNHLELAGHSFTPRINYEKYVREFTYCMDKGFDYVLATHYWEALNNEEMNKIFCDFIENHVLKHETGLLKEIMSCKK